jgi:Tol biopolymer transport system component
MKKTHISLTVFILFGFVFNSIALSWDDDVTHKDLSEYAAGSSVLDKNKGDYLKNFGFVDALDTQVKWGEEKSIKKWLQEGAYREDKQDLLFPLSGTSRSLNHFHNPLKDWSQAGLDDWYLGSHYTGESSLVWAQDSSSQKNVIEGNWSWQKTREYYYHALTFLTDSDRQGFFAQTFRGLGHQMHLLQDTAVPDHVRNDAHPEDALFGKNVLNGSRYFETWAKEERQRIIDLAANPIFPTVSFDVSYNGYVPITQLIDTDQYYGANPSTSSGLGLAEYTNANFFSGDTIFAAERYSPDYRHYFPYPKKTSTDLQSYLDGTKAYEKVIAEDGTEDIGFWISKVSDGETVDHFVKASIYSGLIYSVSGEGSLFYSSFYRDEKCHEDYATKLIPRAVGYSAGLLDYFFRGDLEVTSTSNGIKVKNKSTETMSSYTDSNGKTIGSISIYYDDKNNNRHLLATYELSTSLATDEETPAISYTPPSDNTTTGRYIVVFKGKLGNEEGAVIGKVVSLYQIYYTSARGGIEKIYKMETDGSNSTLIYDNQNSNVYIRKPVVSPDGNTLAFVKYSSIDDIVGTINLFDLANNTESTLTTGDWIDWSPDGSKIVFQRETQECIAGNNPDVEIFTIDAVTGTESQLTNNTCSFTGNPAWSPDGTTIAYSKSQESGEGGETCVNHQVLYLMDTSGNQARPLTCESSGYIEDFAPSWSPDGNEITFLRRTSFWGNFQIYKVSVNTGTITKLTDSDGNSYDEGSTMAWSPEGNTIAIGSNKDGDYDIWLIDPDGGGYIKNLTNSNTEYDIQPSFGK